MKLRNAKGLCYSVAAAALVSGCSGGSSASGVPVTSNNAVAVNSTADRMAFSGTRRLSAGLATAVYLTDVQNDTPLAYYRLNDVGSDLVDSGPNRLNGLIGQGVVRNGAPLTATGDQSLTFSGSTYSTSLFASVPINSAFEPTQAVSLEAWVRPNDVSFSGFVPIVSYGKQSQAPAYAISVTPQNVFQVSVKNGQPGGLSAQGHTAIKPGTVYHLVGTYDGATLSLYINGQPEASKTGSGSIQYVNLSSHDGLGIGGGLDGGKTEFNGSISEVSLYSHALAPTAVLNHYVAGAMPLALVERPRTTANLIDMMGVNTHLHYTGSVYDTKWSQVKQLIIGLGVRHIRDGLLSTPFTAYYDRLEELGKAGVRSTDIAGSNATPALLSWFPTRVPHSFEAYEPPNEPDLNGGSNWVANTRAFQQMMYTTVKSNPATAQYRVFGPAVTNMGNFEKLGDLSSYMDIGNFHIYFPSYNPGNEGYGGLHAPYGVYGSMDFAENIAKVSDGSRHFMAMTETGFNYAAGAPGNLPTDIGAKYLPRLFFEAFNRGLRRAYVYQLLDWESESYFKDGLVDQNLQPKAPYYAMKNLIAVLRDPSPPASTTPLSYALGGNVANVHHTLMQRGDGSYALALWIETRSIVPNEHTADGARISVPTQSVTLQLPSTPGTMAVQAFDNTGNYTTFSPGSIGTSTQIPVTDAVSIVNFHL